MTKAHENEPEDEHCDTRWKSKAPRTKSSKGGWPCNVGKADTDGVECPAKRHHFATLFKNLRGGQNNGIDNGKLMGIVTTTDLINYLLDQF